MIRRAVNAFIDWASYPDLFTNILCFLLLAGGTVLAIEVVLYMERAR